MTRSDTTGNGTAQAAAHQRFAATRREVGPEDVNDRTRAAGNPRVVFPVPPENLIAHAGGTPWDVRERTA